jgi:predicted nucleic acid-binding Zn ribbon protein
MSPPRAARRPEPRDPAPLGGALDEFLRESGISLLLKYPQLHAVWLGIVGEEVGAHARIAALRNGVLEVAVDSSALMTDIRFHKAALLKDLRAAVRKPFIQNIHFIVKPLQDSDDGQERNTPAADA